MNMSPAAEPKAFALNVNGVIGLASSQPNAKRPRRAPRSNSASSTPNSIQSPRKCELYAIGSNVVYPHGKPPVPALPWFERDPYRETVRARRQWRLCAIQAKARLDSSYMPRQEEQGDRGQYRRQFHLLHRRRDGPRGGS